MQSFPRLLSKPVPVFWEGFESDTYRLQRAGWSFTAQQDYAHDSMRLAMRHEQMKMTGITEVTEWEFRREPEHWHLRPRPLRMMATGNVHVFRGDILGSDRDHYRVPSISRFDPAGWHAIDCAPQIVTEEAEPLLAILHFAPLDFKRIILPEDAVPDLMERILKLQQPVRDEHFLNEARKTKVHAQLISLPS